MKPEFKEFEKIARLKRAVTITEKIDGTNAQVHLRAEMGEFEPGSDTEVVVDGIGYYLRAGSRNRWLAHSGGEDNFGFAKWVNANAQSLATLGEGAHYGEWWGSGIQRRYGLSEKRFSLFNTSRWTDQTKPACCHVVPVLYQGTLEGVDTALSLLRTGGSRAAPGFMLPEGIVVYHSASRTLFKVTLEKDEEHKFQRAAS